jgi:hypothetical protein
MTTLSPTETVDMVMAWLNSTFGLSLPVTAPSTWPTFFAKLWSMLVPPPLPQPQDPLPWVIEVEGNFEGLLPEGNTLEVKACVIVAHRTPASPPEDDGRTTSTFIPFPWTRKVN